MEHEDPMEHEVQEFKVQESEVQEDKTKSNKRSRSDESVYVPQHDDFETLGTLDSTFKVSYNLPYLFDTPEFMFWGCLRLVFSEPLNREAIDKLSSLVRIVDNISGTEFLVLIPECPKLKFPFMIAPGCQPAIAAISEVIEPVQLGATNPWYSCCGGGQSLWIMMHYYHIVHAFPTTCKKACLMVDVKNRRDLLLLTPESRRKSVDIYMARPAVNRLLFKSICQIESSQPRTVEEELKSMQSNFDSNTKSCEIV